MIANRHIVIVGAGEEGRMFLEELPSTWTATIIDQDPEALASCPDTHAGQTIDKITGDATSRLVLEQIKLSARTMVAVMTGQDAVNLEVVRMLRTHFKVETLICMLDHLDSEAIAQAGPQLTLHVVDARVPGQDAVLCRPCDCRHRRSEGDAQQGR